MIVLITGAAGLIGSALAERLLRDGHGVIGIVHRTTGIRDSDGALIPVTDFHGSAPKAAEMAILRGDVAQQRLGFDDDILARLDSCVDCIVHCAAMVRFEAPSEELMRVNVEGTLNVAELCPNARFIHVSTAYVCGISNAVVPEAATPADSPYANGYEASKAATERELLVKRPDAVIARPSIVVGEQDSGKIRDFDTIYRAFKFIAEGRIQTVPVGAGAMLNFVPIDYVAEGLADLVRLGPTGPRFVHLAAQDGIAAERFLDLIGAIPGLSSPTIVEPHAYEGLATGIADRLAQPYWPYFARSPDFAVQELERLSGRAAPTMDDAAFCRQIEYCVSAGFIKPRS